jgi:hypothetical protein
MIFALDGGTECAHSWWNKGRFLMHILAMFFFVAAAALALRVVTDILSEDGNRMWAALMGRSMMGAQVNAAPLPFQEGSARVVTLRPVRPQSVPDLPLAA